MRRRLLLKALREVAGVREVALEHVEAGGRHPQWELGRR